MRIIDKVVRIKDVAKTRDKLDALFEKEKKYHSQLSEDVLDWCQEELRNAFDFDGEEE